MRASVRKEVLSRAAGRCECSCGRLFGKSIASKATIDHVFGRAQQEETPDLLWALRWDCHFEKTTNSPSAQHWLEKFIEHCKRHGFFAAGARARLKAEWLSARRGAA